MSQQKSKEKEFIKLGIFLTIIILILGGFIFYLSIPLLSQKSVVLATMPIDPFDPIRGQYITIRYEIGTLPSVSSAYEGDTIYISLKEDNEGIWRYESASLSKPKEGDFIKGEITSISGDTMRVKYGIEQYFFERNAKFETRDITVEVKLANNGRATITRLLKDGKPIEIEYQNKTLTS